MLFEHLSSLHKVTFSNNDNVGGASPLIFYFRSELIKADNINCRGHYDYLDFDSVIANSDPLSKPFLFRNKHQPDYTHFIRHYTQIIEHPPKQFPIPFWVKYHAMSGHYFILDDNRLGMIDIWPEKRTGDTYYSRWYCYHGLAQYSQEHEHEVTSTKKRRMHY
jgi:hypothetical protein